MADRCGNCGAPLEAGAAICRYCGAATRTAEQAGPAEPAEIREAATNIRARMGDPKGLLKYLSDSLSPLGDDVVRGSRAGRLTLNLGFIQYSLRPSGAACVVERQAVAAGMAVGMNDVVPASRWPEMLAVDVARAADERGVGWREVNKLLR
jgi:hypothetical protein